MGAALPLLDLTEQAWDAQLFRGPKALARTLGWTSYHVLHSKGSAHGYPDRTCWRERVVFVELKSETGKPTDAQIATLTGLAKAGGECYLWRPRDLDEIAKVLSKRWDFTPYGLIGHGVEWHWKPGSLWLPDGRRNDENVQEVMVA
jgi:hypothetical protein